MNGPDGRSHRLTQVTKVQPEPTFHNTAPILQRTGMQSVVRYDAVVTLLSTVAT